MIMTHDKEPIVEIRDLVARYGEKTVLSDITTDIYPSEICVILGTSGCGKTTLLKHIIGLIKPYSGYVKVFGHRIGDLDSAETAEVLKRVGILFQNGALLGSLTVKENIALPLRMHTSLPGDVVDEIVQAEAYSGGPSPCRIVVSGRAFGRDAQACCHGAGACARPAPAFL